jgi:hypothetical protein
MGSERKNSLPVPGGQAKEDDHCVNNLMLKASTDRPVRVILLHPSIALFVYQSTLNILVHPLF